MSITPTSVPDPPPIPWREPVELEAITVHGWLGERIERAMVAVDNLLGSLWWHGSGWGYEHAARWLRNEVLFGRYAGRWHSAIDSVARTMLELVEDGRAFRDYATHALAAYNEEEFLAGLLAYHRHCPEPMVLDAARRMGRSLATNSPHLAGNHYYKSLAIGPLLDLAAVTGDEQFRAAAVAIAEDQQTAAYEQPGTGDGGWGPHGAHGAAVCVIMAAHLALFQATGDRRYFDWASQAWENLRRRIFITGGMGEHVMLLEPADQGADLHDETCQHAWWLIANLRFWRLTGGRQYIEMVERTLYNHLLFAQLHRGEDGGFCALGNVDQGFRGQHNYICCDNEGTFCLFEVARHIITADAATRMVSVNLLIPAAATVQLDGDSRVQLRVQTDYPVGGRVSVAVEVDRPIAFAMRLRVPCGGVPTTLAVNGQAIDMTRDGDYCIIDREWQPGDQVDLVFPLPMRVEADNTGFGAVSAPVAVDGQSHDAKRFGVFHGPVLAAMFRAGHGNDLNWVWTGDYPECLDSGGDVFEGFPGSKLDYLEAGGLVHHTSGCPQQTNVTTSGGAARVQWTHLLGEDVTVEHDVLVYPGLPLTLDWRQTVRGWRGEGRLLCGGVRFGTAKRSKSLLYGDCAFPYPMPAVTTRDNLDPGNGFIAGGGSFSLAEPLTDGGELSRTGTYRLSNGYFRVICHYDVDSVRRLVGRVEPTWAGVYFEPEHAEVVVLRRRLIFPLHAHPLSQDLTRCELDHAQAVRAEVVAADAGARELHLDGPVIQHTPVPIAFDLGLHPGDVLHNLHTAATVVKDSDDRMVVRVAVPGRYAIRQQP